MPVLFFRSGDVFQQTGETTLQNHLVTDDGVVTVDTSADAGPFLTQLDLRFGMSGFLPAVGVGGRICPKREEQRHILLTDTVVPHDRSAGFVIAGHNVFIVRFVAEIKAHHDFAGNNNRIEAFQRLGNACGNDFRVGKTCPHGLGLANIGIDVSLRVIKTGITLLIHRFFPKLCASVG